MSPASFEIPNFRPQRKLFGYERRATDRFLGHVAELLEQASERLAQVEAELAEKREGERSLNEALMVAARTADAIKQDAHRDADAIRAEVRELDEFVAATRSHLSSFLQETLERLERVSNEIETAHDRVEQIEEEEQVGASVTAEEGTPSDTPEVTSSAEAGQQHAGPPEAADSVLERLRPYRGDSPR